MDYWISPQMFSQYPGSCLVLEESTGSLQTRPRIHHWQQHIMTLPFFPSGGLAVGSFNRPTHGSKAWELTVLSEVCGISTVSPLLLCRQQASTFSQTQPTYKVHCDAYLLPLTQGKKDKSLTLSYPTDRSHLKKCCSRKAVAYGCVMARWKRVKT